MTPQQIEAVTAWVDQGAKEGAPKDLPPAPQFVDGWSIGKPDVILSMAEEFTLDADGPDEYQYFDIPTNFTEDKYVVMAEARPGNRKIVHHIIAFVAAYAPGRDVDRWEPGLAKQIPAGSSLRLQLHYSKAAGSAQKDRSMIGLVFAKEPPQRQVFTASVQNIWFQIPPGANKFCSKFRSTTSPGRPTMRSNSRWSFRATAS